MDSAALTLLHEVFPGRLAPSDRWGLGKIRALCEALGNPQSRFPCLHVGGTNGKGSVAAMLASVLRAAGHRVGLYTSPHLMDFAERVRIDGIPAADEELRAAARALETVVDTVNPAFFEVATAVAFQIFAAREVDMAVVEVGLGGRLDATNIVTPLVAGVTNIGLDHSDLLGDTYESVAREKAGIAKRGVPFLTTEARPQVRQVLLDRARALGAAPEALDASAIEWLEGGIAPPRARVKSSRWGPLDLEVPLRGRHQALNVLLAVRMLERAGGRWVPDAETVRRGVAATRWPGRLDRRELDGRPWLFDVAHNAEGMRTLAEAVDRMEMPAPRHALFGVLADKDWKRMLPLLLAQVDRVVLCEPPSVPGSRRWDPSGALEWARGQGLERVVLEPDFPVAVRAVAQGAASVIVTGSVHTVGDAFHELGLIAFDSTPQ